MNRHVLPVAVTALAVAASGCGSGDDAKTTAASSTAAQVKPAATPQELLGTYSRAVSKADIERTTKKRSELGPDQEKPKPGVSVLFVEPAALTVRDPKATFVVQQDYSATGAGKLAIRGYQHPDRGSFCGPEVPQNASYTWKAAGDKLTLSAVDDPCADRDSTLTGVWVRK
jgi:hypothetical protein